MNPPPEIGRRDLLSIFMWIVAALLGRWKVPAQLAPATELVQQVITHRSIFKNGSFKLGIRIKGWEMPVAWKDDRFRAQFAQALHVGLKEEEKTDDPVTAR